MLIAQLHMLNLRTFLKIDVEGFESSAFGF